MKKIVIFLVLIISIALVFTFKKTNVQNILPVIKIIENQDPLAISVMRNRTYSGSDIVVEQTLSQGSDYNQYSVSYKSDNLKIYALMTVPEGQKPKNGWPVIIFNHGYIPPDQYVTTERYIAYVDVFARDGYIVFKSDYRGNGKSEGQPEGAYYSPAYTTDILNAASSIKKYKDADPSKIGMWGHSMGGNVTLRNLVVDTKDIKAAVIWGGVVGSYEDLMFNWQRRVSYQPSAPELALRNRSRSQLVTQYGDPRKNPNFWNTIDPTNFTKDITAPVQLDVGGSDEEVPVAFSTTLYEKLKKEGKVVEYYEYNGSDHNISQGFSLAMQRSVDFFNKYLK